MGRCEGGGSVGFWAIAVSATKNVAAKIKRRRVLFVIDRSLRSSGFKSLDERIGVCRFAAGGRILE